LETGLQQLVPELYVGRLEQNLLGLGLAAVVLTLGAWGASATILDAGTSTSDGLIAEYRFDTGAGNTAYDTSGNNDGTLENGADWAQGINGKSASFDGQDDFAETNLRVDQTGSQSYTFSVWAYPTESRSSRSQLIGTGGTDGGFDWALLMENNDWYVFTGEGSRRFADLDTQEWQHLTAVYDTGSDEVRVYKNGKLRETHPIGYDSTTGDLAIGQRSERNDENFPGRADEVRIYSSALNTSQIKSIYNSGSWRIGTNTEEDGPSKVLDISFQHQNNTHVYDTSGYENHGTRENGVGQASSVDCKIGRCYSFDGNDDYVDVEESPGSFSDSVTVTGWLNPDRIQGDNRQWLVEEGDGFMSYIDGGNSKLYFRLTADQSQTTWNSGYTVKAGEWQHIGLVYDGTTMRAYVDGSLVGTRSKTGDLQTIQNLKIGADALHNGDFYNGRIDQVKIFNRSLSQSEIVEKTQGLDSGGAVLDLQFNRDGGDLAEDSSGRNNHGRLEPSETAGPSRVQGVTGNALHLDGENDYADIGNQGSLNFEPGDSFSYSVWFKPEDYSDIESGYVWIHHERSYLIQRKSNDMNLTSNIGGSRTPFNKKPEPGEWNHAVLTYRDGTLTLYYNGKQVNQASATAEDMTSSDLAVTTPRLGQNWYADGSVDKVKAYPYRLSSDSVQNIYERENSAVKQRGDRADLENGLALSQTFNRVETCGQSDTISCPSGANGEISVDESGEANHGELLNGVEQEDSQNCVRGRCVRLDGSEDQIEVNSDSGLRFSDGQGFTVSSWVEADPSSIQDSDHETFLSKGSFDSPPVYGLQTTPDNDIRFFLKDSSGSNLILDGPNIEAGKFTHVTATYDGSQADLYVNGKKTSSSTNNLGDFKGSQNLFIGLNNRVGGPGKYQYWDGLVDQSRVYNRSLSDQEVWRLYAQGRDRSASSNGPMKHFTGSSSLQSVTDRVGRDGTLGSDTSRETSDPDVASGYIGTGLEFSDSDNEYVEVENPVDPTDASESMSVSFWLKPDSGTGANALVEWSTGGGFDAHIWQFDSEDDFLFNPRGTCSAREATGVVKLDQWAHYTVLYDAPENEFRWYVDGKVVKSATESCQIDTSSDKLRLGKRVGANRALDGKLDEVKIFPYALSEKQIREEASAGVKPGRSVYGIPNSCEEVQERSGTQVSGIRKIDPDGPGGQPPVDVYCGNSVDGGGWTLVYNYDHKGGTNPDVVEGKWPKSEGAFSHVDGISSYGFQSSDIEEVRFYCETSNHDRKVHYKTRDRDVVQGILDNSSTIGYESVANDSAKLAGHTGFLPDAANRDTGESEPGPSMFGPGFPMFEGGDYHWSIGEPNRGGNRWECDDFPDGPQHDTLHQIWVR
jgi:hypothetical protein